MHDIKKMILLKYKNYAINKVYRFGIKVKLI